MSKIADFIRNVKPTTCSVVVVAAGSSVRMGEDKLYLSLRHMPVLARTLRALDACECVDEIVLVTRADRLEKAAELCREYSVSKISHIVAGGKNRCESALAGLTEIRRSAKIVLIHDGARPLVTEDIVKEVVHQAALYKCAAPAVSVTDTVKEAQEDTVLRTLDRNSLVAMQTPQAFWPDIIKAALTVAVREGKEYTDDCAAVEAMGVKVHLSQGSRENIKITHPLDLKTAEAILESREH